MSLASLALAKIVIQDSSFKKQKMKTRKRGREKGKKRGKKRGR